MREEIASVQHEIWAHWMRYLFSQCVALESGTILMPDVLVKRWKRQMKTPYSELTDRERESDRNQADKVLAAIAKARGDAASLPVGPQVKFEVKEITQDEALRKVADHLREMTAYLFLAGYHT